MAQENGIITKEDKIKFGLKKIEEILDCVNKNKPWILWYKNSEKGEYIFIFDNEGNKLYSIDVTADSVLTALSELMNLLARKY